MKYLTYEDFTSMGGTLAESEFDRFEFRAEKLIDNETFGRIKELIAMPEEVSRCTFELVTYLSNVSKGGDTSAVASFGNDGYSVSYVEKKTADRQIYDIIYTYLSDTGLMYCGTDEPTGYSFSKPIIPDGYAVVVAKVK